MIRAVTSSYKVVDGKAVWDGRPLAAWVPDLVADIAERFSPARIVLFGSVAQGTDGPDSDIDLLVVMPEAPPGERRELMFKMRKATRVHDVPRDILVTSLDDYQRRRQQLGTIEHETELRGQVVYERPLAA